MKLDSTNKQIFTHIQLLRAVAIVMVFGFHLNLPGFKYGYLGVDIFFVISGFLMMKIYSGLEINRIKQFYLKRFLRLMPAYLVVSFLTTIVFLVFIPPYERTSIAKQHFYANISLSNFYYWAENQYFSNSSLRPLLTFWSLALEIQFYLLFPLIFMFIKKIKVFVIITFFSLTLFVVLDQISPESSFFLLPSRLWEFLVGVWLASFLMSFNHVQRVSTPTFNMALASFPTLLVIFDLLKVEKNVLINLLAVSYTLILLFIGFNLVDDRSYSIRFGLLVGRYSYSIYLVHLPIISLLYYKPFSNNFKYGDSLSLNLIIVFFVLVFSFVLFHLVEQPFRRGKMKPFLLFYLISFLISAGSMFASQLWKNIGVDPMIQKISFSQEDRPKYRCGTFDRIEILHAVINSADSCLLSRKDSGSRFLLVGDSHADSINGVLNNKLESDNNTLYMLRNPSSLNSENLSLVKQEVINRDIDVIIVHSQAGKLDKSVFYDLVKFIEKNRKRLIVIGPIPTYDKSVPLLVYNDLFHNKVLELRSVHFFRDLYQLEVDFYRKLSGSSQVAFYDSVNNFCSKTCPLVDDKTDLLLYFDNEHLTNTGARFLLKDFESVIKVVLK
jgi:peptidoglycan/LPS O-acetylase OafA/YrhL